MAKMSAAGLSVGAEYADAREEFRLPAVHAGTSPLEPATGTELCVTLIQDDYAKTRH
jgi:hypothetical protein